ncbi:MAG: ABC transporter ATP-binding protein [Verrucomicrobiota bacterium]
MSTVISIEDVSKLYRLGEIGTGSLAHDVNRWWHKARGKEDPYLKVGQSNDRSTKGDSDYVYAIKDVSFEVEQGEALGIIGRNGAGKSTLLKILSRVTTPTSGQIKAKGRIASLLEVGTGFHPELTGRENIFLNGAILGMRKHEIRSKFDEIVDFSGCERYIDTPVKRYSSGMYVRLAFAVAAHLESEILIVDEVLAVGDAEFQKKCLGKMKDVAGHGRTVIFVSHNMAAVKMLCLNSIVLSEGRLKMAGPTHECIECYHGNNSATGDTLMSNVRHEDHEVKVKSIVINGQSSNEITIPSEKNVLNVTIEAWLEQPKNIDLEVVLADKNQTHLATYAPSHDQGFTALRPAGEYKLEYSIQLPKRINKGDFLLHLYLTHPNFAYLTKIENIHLRVEGVPNRAGRVFEYSAGAGLMFLDSCE